MQLPSQALPANELMARAAVWAQEFGLETGIRPLHPEDGYPLSNFFSPNCDALSGSAAHQFSLYQGEGKTRDTAAISAFAFESITLLPCGVLLNDNAFVKETLDVLPAHYRNRAVQAAADAEPIASDEDCPVLVIEQPTILNYGHWLIEMMPKIMPFLDGIRNGRIKLCLPGTPKFVSQTLTYLKIYTHHLLRVTQFPTRLKRVLYVSPISKHGHPGYVSPWVSSILNQTTGEISASGHDKIFVSRKDASKRVLANEDEVFSLLEPLGYVRIETARMSFADQVSYFRGASKIIGVFGASLTNLIFCRENARSLLICPNTFFDHFYWNLASLRKGEYHQVNGISEGHDADFSAPPDLVLKSALRLER